MDKKDVNALIFLRLDHLKMEIQKRVDFIFDHCENPVTRSTLVCSLISDLEFLCSDVLEGRPINENKKVCC